LDTVVVGVCLLAEKDQLRKFLRRISFVLFSFGGAAKALCVFFFFFRGLTEILGTGGSSLRASSSTSAGWDVVSAG
jgi:hypothetical protein